MSLQLERPILAGVIAALLGTAIVFRSISLASVPGISGDEGWWGIQALAWLSDRPYEAHTTSGNPTDLFHLIPLALMHALARPSFFLLRALPALVNLLALPMAFWFVRRLYGSTTAWIHTVALAILPTAIAHSRICQDPSQTVFWTGLFIYLCLLGLQAGRRGWIHLGAAIVVFPVVLWTHPTNVFVAPFLVLPVVAAAGPLLPPSWHERALVILAAALAAILGLSVAWIAFRYVAASNELLDKPWLSIAVARMIDGGQWVEFAANNARLFSGVTVYHYFSGARPATLPYDAGFVAVVLASLSGFLLAPAPRRSRLDHGLIAACTVTWIVFFAFAGPGALRPHVERWGLCLLVPGSLILARGLSGWIEWRPRWRFMTMGAATLVATALLGSFYVNYFREFATSGGRSHLTYVTAPIEPKRHTLESILRQRPGPGRVIIIAKQWWLFWPIAYLATEYPHVSVSVNIDVDRQPDFQQALEDGSVFFVEFTGTPQLAETQAWILGRGLRAASTTIRDASGRGLVEILHVGR
jgi:hypothetical protein